MKDQLAAVSGCKGFMPFTHGRVSRLIMGGPYMAFAKRRPLTRECNPVVGVLMAAELEYLDHDIFVPTKDFSVPTEKDFRRGLMQSIAQMGAGRDLYVGCMGGIGRTGLLLAGLAKVMGVEDPVAYVRKHYYSHAVETKDQKYFIMMLDVSDIQKWALMI